MAGNKHALTRYRVLDACFSNWMRKYYAEDLIKKCNEALAERYPLTVVSNGFQEVQYYKLMHSGLRQHFENVILSEEIGVQKPSVRFFDIALDTANLKRREHNLPPLTTDDILMIGDSYTSDIKGAIAAHIDQLWLCPDSEAMTDDSRPATYKVIGLNKILPLLENCRS